MNYFLDLNRYTANAKTKQIATGTKSLASLPSPIQRLTEPYANIPKNITFCKLLRPNNHSLIFFKVQSIILPLVVNFQFFWGTGSDDRGLNSIRPIPLFDLSCVPYILNTIRINHLRDNVW